QLRGGGFGRQGMDLREIGHVGDHVRRGRPGGGRRSGRELPVQLLPCAPDTAEAALPELVIGPAAEEVEPARAPGRNRGCGTQAAAKRFPRMPLTAVRETVPEITGCPAREHV